MAEWIIRRAAADDIAALIALDSFAGPCNGRAAEIDHWVATCACFCAVKKGMPLGYGVLHKHFFGQPMLELVMVGQKHRGQGIGAALIHHAIDQAGAVLWTSTNQSNHAMQRLLERLGFRRSGIVEGLDEGDPELIYRRVA